MLLGIVSWRVAMILSPIDPCIESSRRQAESHVRRLERKIKDLEAGSRVTLRVKRDVWHYAQINQDRQGGGGGKARAEQINWAKGVVTGLC